MRPALSDSGQPISLTRPATGCNALPCQGAADATKSACVRNHHHLEVGSDTKVRTNGKFKPKSRSDSPSPTLVTENTAAPVTLKRVHTQRLREVYRSAGWPYQDVVEIDLLAAGLLTRSSSDTGHPLIALTDAGIAHLAQATQGNRQARSVHEALVDRVAQAMLRDDRLVWTGLNLRAKVAGESEDVSRWKMCQPDVFSIRNSSRQEYLEPIVHEIKVSRADLLGDIKRIDKRAAYLDVGGQCWYVLGCDRSGYPIAKANEIPLECGVMVVQNKQLEVLRMAPKRTVSQLPFSLWMALAKATPMRLTELVPCQDGLGG